MRVQRWVKLSLAVATSLLLTVSSSVCLSQPASSRETPEQAARTKIEFPAEGVHPPAQATLDERLRAHLDYLTSETCQGRQVGTLRAGRAAGYVLQEFKSIGLEPAFGDGHVQEFIPLNVQRSTRGWKSWTVRRTSSNPSPSTPFQPR